MDVRVALVDDHHMFRDALRAALSAEPGITVVADGSDANAAIDIARESSPHVMLVDLSMNGADGIVAAREIHEKSPATKVLMLTMHAKPAMAVDAFVAGAQGYAVKSQRLPELVEAIRHVARGGQYLSPILPRTVLDTARRRQFGGGETGPLASLSEREREVFRLAVHGMSNDGIAESLTVSVKTVETHRAHINRKLGLHSPADLIRFAANNGLLVD